MVFKDKLQLCSNNRKKQNFDSESFSHLNTYCMDIINYVDGVSANLVLKFEKNVPRSVSLGFPVFHTMRHP